MRFRKLLIVFISILVIVLNHRNGYTQELNCRIQVNSSQIQGTNKTVFETLQKSLFEFLNNRNWTKHVYSTEERIECNFMLNITKQNSVDEFEGTLQVNSSRPVLNSGYSTPLFIYLDKKVKFRYAEGEALDFSENTHHELSSLFAYYVYVVLGYDYDSFSLMGGTEYFQMAEKIVTTAQSSTSGGWKAFEDRKNRYWLIENTLNQVYAPVRLYYYNYHRLGLDVMHKNLADGRTKIAEGLNDLLKVHRAKQNSFIMQILFEAKSEELIKILSESPVAEGTKAYNLLKEMDASNAAKYQKIIKKA